MLPERSTISHYRILSHIGAGGMGEVYLAEDVNLGRRVALKILPAQFNSDEDRLRRFEQEARAASALNHPNIITIHEVGTYLGTRFIATEFIEGDTVRQKLKQSGIGIREALNIAIQVARALAAAHRAGIIHRDIKPENVMIRPDGIVKVLDFGVVKLTERFAEHQSGAQTADSDNGDVATFGMITTEANIVMGSPNYMSPEQARGLAVDGRTDIFSFGALIYEMLTGKMPFKGATVSDVIVAILERQPPKISECVPEAPPKIEAIVERSMAKNLDARYQSVDELITDLKQARRRLEREAGIDDSLRPVHTADAAKTNQQQRDTAGEPAPEDDHVPTITAVSSAEFIVGEIKRHKRGLLIVLASTALVFALFVYFTIFAKAHRIDSIAVLPFINVSSDANMEYLSEGLTESLINNLSQSHNLKVMSRNAMFRYSGQEADPKKIGRELGVHGVLTGRIVQRGDTISINVELIDARDDTQFWGEQYNRRMSDLSLLQEEIARQVSDKLQLRLSGDDKSRLKKLHTDDAEAYQSYLKGRFYSNKRTEEGLKKALPFFNQAIEMDPSYALAYAGLADCYALLYEYSATPSKDLYPKAKAAAMRALELDESLAEAHTSLAAAYEYEWNWNEAAKQYERAIELNPNYETAHHWYSAYLVSRKQFDEAIRQAQRALDLDPLSLIINTALGRALNSARRYDEAVEQLRTTVDMDPNFAEAHFHLGLAYEGKGAYDDAIRELTKAAELFGDRSLTAWVGRVYALSGRTAQAMKVLEDMLELSKQQPVSPYSIASLYATLGEKDRAFEWLEKVYQERNYYVVFLNVDPTLDSLRDDPRFTDLLKRIGLNS